MIDLVSEEALGKHLLFVTGTRADYGKLEPLAKAARDNNFKVSFFITGMHMMRRYGETRYEVRRFEGASFFEYVNQREGDALDFILSKTILGFSDFISEHTPDLVVIHGDRVEALAASIVCAMRYIRTAHVEGGEVSGTIDESIRHCNTKLCTKHFVSNDIARARVLSLGEPARNIFNIGSPELDTHALPSGVTIKDVTSYYRIPFSDFGIAIFHPVTSERCTILGQAESLFSALSESKRNFVVISPNNDPGCESIFSVIENLPAEQFRIIPSMRFNFFSELMKNSAAIIGNSSAGVREAPFIGLPSLDVGTRQLRRATAPSVFTCSPFDREGIKSFITKYWGKKFKSSDSFGNGDSSTRFVEAIKARDFWGDDLQKYFSGQVE